jgi:hypothetical protein
MICVQTSTFLNVQAGDAPSDYWALKVKKSMLTVQANIFAERISHNRSRRIEINAVLFRSTHKIILLTMKLAALFPRCRKVCISL